MTNCMVISRKITFRNMQAHRVGEGIQYYRVHVVDKTREEFAKTLEIEENDLERLEEGYEPIVDRAILEKIAKLAGVNLRGNKLWDDDLLNIFMNVP